VLDDLRLWVSIAVVLVVLAYALPLAAIVQDGGPLGPGIDASPVWIDGVVSAGRDAAGSVADAALGWVIDAVATPIEGAIR
jgi:cytochrome c oxidase subunit 1